MSRAVKSPAKEAAQKVEIFDGGGSRKKKLFLLSLSRRIFPSGSTITRVRGDEEAKENRFPFPEPSQRKNLRFPSAKSAVTLTGSSRVPKR